MRKRLILLFALLLPVMCFPAAKEKTARLRCGTFNIRLKTPVDDEKGWGWDVRRDRVANYVKKKHLDIVGMQEVLHAQLEDLLERLPEYDYVGVGRTDGKTTGEYSPIFFLKEKFEVLEKGNFWLSETPDVPGSVGWDAALERIASYAKLKDKRTGKVFMAVNTHFDHVGVKARRESARLIMRKIDEIVGERPAIVTGDFNVAEDDEAYKTMLGGEMAGDRGQERILHDAYHMNARHTGTNYTWHNYCRIPPSEAEKIDFIFLTPAIRVKRTHIEEPRPEAMLSDHNPHWADLEF